METNEATVFIIDDDKAICRGLSFLLMSEGYKVETFCDTLEILINDDYNEPGCFLLDVFLGAKSALNLQKEINEKFPHIPIIFITGNGSVPMSVQAIKQGAINFLQKPINDEQLFKAVDEALILSNKLLIQQNDRANILLKFELLTPREVDVFKLLITGLLNKQIAAELNIAEHTVKLHRGKITTKLEVKSVAELVQLSEKLKISVANI